MALKICRYKMKMQEEKLWNQDEMDGWRKAFEACVEDEARDAGNKKYEIYDRAGEIVAKNIVRPLPEMSDEMERIEI